MGESPVDESLLPWGTPSRKQVSHLEFFTWHGREKQRATLAPLELYRATITPSALSK